MAGCDSDVANNQGGKTEEEIPLASLEGTTLIQAKARSQERAFFYRVGCGGGIL